MGIFDVAGLGNINPTFSLGSPQFEKITIKLDPTYYKGKEFVIETKNNSKENKYAQHYILNGEKVSGLRIPFHTVTSGGKLEVEMGNMPKDKY